MSDFLLSQLIAAIAFGCGAVSFQLKSRRSILLWLSGSAIVNACHFFILGRAAPGVLYLTMGARSLTAAFSVNRKIMYVFIGLVVIGFFYSYKTQEWEAWDPMPEQTETAVASSQSETTNQNL